MTRGSIRRYLWPSPTPEFAISLEFLVWAPVLLFSVVAHEYAHAEAAYRQGDDTALMLGRLTLNPLKHIDPFMTVILPLMMWLGSSQILGRPVVFGGAKPVPVNTRKFRKFVRGNVIVSLAGIAVNLVLFVVSAGLFALTGILGSDLEALTPTVEILQRMWFYGMWLNLVLAFFNLIPIPPLDGSHVFYHLLPPEIGLRYRQLYAFGFIPIMLVVLLLPQVVGFFLWPAYRLMELGLSIVGHYAVSPGAFPS
ncbi:MAG: site-2 protease family protein [Gemmatimonadales bacterium]